MKYNKLLDNSIYTIEDFLSKDKLNNLNNYLNDFKIVETPDHNFHVMEPTKQFNNFIENKISEIEGYKIENILSIFRISTNDLDTKWRIHCDSIINDKIPKRAVVLYISKSPMQGLHGTAFWEHKVYGDSLSYEDLDTDKFNNILLNDSENLSMWKLNSVIGYKQNKLVSYPSNYFHSKYPNKSWEQGRKIFVMFYK